VAHHGELLMAEVPHERDHVAGVPYAQRHLADVEIFEREVVNTSYSDRRDVRVRDEAGRSVLGGRSIPARGPEDWHGHRGA
jgi:hypothetical protein